MEAVLPPQSTGWRIQRAVTRAFLSAKRRCLKGRIGRLVIEQAGEISLVVLPEVFNPVVFRTSLLLADAIPLCEGPRRALDLGTGSGIVGLAAARRGYEVVATDINPAAVRCARINALLNSLEARSEVREGDLFAPVEGERFDLVLFNPPFFRGRPRDMLDAAWRGDSVLERFAGGLRTVLAHGGEARIVLSTDGEQAVALHLIRLEGFTVEVAARRDFGNEVISVYAVRCAE